MNYKTKQKIKRIIPSSLFRYAKGIANLFDKRPPIVYNLGKDVTNKYNILFCYIPNFMFCAELNELIGTREKECSAFVHALIANGCSVDVCNVDYTGPFKSNYDYIIGQGISFRIARAFNPSAKSVLYLTEMPPGYSYEKEKERSDYLFERHHIKVDYERSGKYFIDSDFKDLDGCIMMGKDSDSSYVSGTKTFMLRPTGLKNCNFDLKKRNVSEAKKNFIWIGSFGAVHKGLDILFDVFARHPEFTLHVLGLQPQERKLLRRIKPENVKDYGFVQISTDEFVNIAIQCAFMIYPSCSERVATSVITAMNHGIIPLVSEICSIETIGCGESLIDYHVEYVDQVIMKWFNKSNNELEEKMNNAIKTANQHYTLENYSASIHDIISSILKK